MRNSQGGGSTNGVIGSGGAAPTNWTINANANGVTSEVIGTGTENGLAYIDVKVSGTPTANGSVNVGLESTSQVVAANGQTWTLSAFVKLQSGSTANATTSVAVRGRLVGGGAVAGQTSETTITPTSANLNSQRFLATITFSNATVERVWPPLTVSYTQALAIDITLRIAAPQLELGAFPTSYTPTTSASATRAAETPSVTPVSSFYNATEGTLFCEATTYAGEGNARAIFALNDSSENNRNTLFLDDGGQFVVSSGGTGSATIDGGTISDSINKIAATYRVDDFAMSLNGGSVATDTLGAVPVGVTHAFIGYRGTGAVTRTNGHIRKVANYPKRLTNTLLEQLTT